MQRPDDVFMRRGRESRHIRSYKDDEDSQQSLVTGANFRAEGESEFAKCDSSYE